MISLHNKDCLEFMQTLPDNSIDFCLTDPPYGTTQNKWDSIIPFEPMWEQLARVVKDDGAIALFGQGIFSCNLSLSNKKNFRYTVVFEKTKAGGFLNANRRPLQAHEDILIFYRRQPTYVPQFSIGTPYTKKAITNGDTGNYSKFERVGQVAVNEGKRYPRSIVKFSNDNHNSFHPTQKPVALLEYLIKTYTLESETVLDFTMGSGSTAVACMNTGRKFVGCELDPIYFEVAKERLKNARPA